MKLAPRTRNARLLSEEEELFEEKLIDHLKKDTKEPFLKDVLIKFKSDIGIDSPFF